MENPETIHAQFKSFFLNPTPEMSMQPGTPHHGTWAFRRAIGEIAFLTSRWQTGWLPQQICRFRI